VVFVHPTTTGLGLPALEAHYLWNSIGNPVETAIAAAQLVTNGVLARHQHLRVLLAHGGGALLTLRGRLERAFAVRPEARAASPVPPRELLRGLYYDSLTHDRAVLADLVAFAGPDHVVLGSDRPFDMGAGEPADDVAALGLKPADEQLLLSGTARMLLGLKDDE
jgi:aminocarboxymuconate-semialdehyde decarboxylase